jgi:hypothetical protein
MVAYATFVPALWRSVALEAAAPRLPKKQHGAAQPKRQHQYARPGSSSMKSMSAEQTKQKPKEIGNANGLLAGAVNHHLCGVAGCGLGLIVHWIVF